MAEINTTQEMMKAFNDFLQNNPAAKVQIKQEIDQILADQDTVGNTTNDSLVTVMENLTIQKNARLKRYELGENFYRYCDRFIRQVGLTNIKPEHQYDYFIQNLNDQTYSVLKDITLTTVQKNDCSLFCEVFKKTMYSNRTFSLKEEVRACRQKPDESIAEYVFRLREKADIAYQNPADANENCLLAFLQGIRSNEIRRKVNESSVETFSQVVVLAEKLERVQKQFENTNSTILRTKSVQDKSISRVSGKSGEQSSSSRYSQREKWEKDRDYRSHRETDRYGHDDGKRHF